MSFIDWDSVHKEIVVRMKVHFDSIGREFDVRITPKYNGVFASAAEVSLFPTCVVTDADEQSLRVSIERAVRYWYGHGICVKVYSASTLGGVQCHDVIVEVVDLSAE
jgi:hypothetical protein